MIDEVDHVCREAAAAYGDTDDRTLALLEAAETAACDLHAEPVDEWLVFLDGARRLMDDLGVEEWSRALGDESRSVRRLLESAEPAPGLSESVKAALAGVVEPAVAAAQSWPEVAR
jgi:hypothetical protein